MILIANTDTDICHGSEGHKCHKYKTYDNNGDYDNKNKHKYDKL